MCGCHCVVVKDLTIGGFPASVGSPIPRGQTLLGQDRPVGRHVIKVFRAYATGRRGRNGNARQRRLWRRSINWRHRRLLSGWKCLGRRIFRHPVVMCASGNCHERQPQSGCLAGSSRIESNADQGRGTRGFPDLWGGWGAECALAQGGRQVPATSPPRCAWPRSTLSAPAAPPRRSHTQWRGAAQFRSAPWPLRGDGLRRLARVPRCSEIDKNS